MIEPTDLVAVLACGTSGAGRALQPHLLASEIMGAAKPYAVGGVHRHIPEIEQNLSAAAGAPVSLSFTPSLGVDVSRRTSAPLRHTVAGSIAVPFQPFGRSVRSTAAGPPAAEAATLEH